MRYQDLIEHYGSQAAAARALNITRAAVNQWRASGIPRLRQLHIESVTAGQLVAEHEGADQHASAPGREKVA